MIISRKKFEQEIQRRVRATIRYKVMEALAEENQEQIEKLQKRIRKLEKEQERKGTIHGFYESPTETTITTIVRKEGENEVK